MKATSKASNEGKIAAKHASHATLRFSSLFSRFFSLKARVFFILRALQFLQGLTIPQ